MDENNSKKNEIGLAMNLDTTPVLYTDNVRLTTNRMGVVLGFGQSIDTTNQIRIVSRIGMSREHAKILLKELGSLLAMTEGDLQTNSKRKN